MVSAAMAADDQLATARDPFEAVQLIESAPPDAVLWDVDTRVEDAVVACHTLRRHSQAPIVMLVSAYAQEEVLRGYRLGADAHIPIPCDRREFSARFHAILRRMSKSNWNFSELGSV